MHVMDLWDLDETMFVKYLPLNTMTGKSDSGQ